MKNTKDADLPCLVHLHPIKKTHATGPNGPGVMQASVPAFQTCLPFCPRWHLNPGRGTRRWNNAQTSPSASFSQARWAQSHQICCQGSSRKLENLGLHV